MPFFKRWFIPTLGGAKIQSTWSMGIFPEDHCFHAKLDDYFASNIHTFFFEYFSYLISMYFVFYHSLSYLHCLNRCFSFFLCFLFSFYCWCLHQLLQLCDPLLVWQTSIHLTQPASVDIYTLRNKSLNKYRWLPSNNIRWKMNTSVHRISSIF